MDVAQRESSIDAIESTIQDGQIEELIVSAKKEFEAIDIVLSGKLYEHDSEADDVIIQYEEDRTLAKAIKAPVPK